MLRELNQKKGHKMFNFKIYTNVLQKKSHRAVAGNKLQ